MITRPLDLGSKLRPLPRNFDVVFLVNGGLIALFFSVFGSRFVLAPGLGLDFQLPEMPAGQIANVAPTHYITVQETGVIITDEGSITAKRLGEWLDEQAKTTARPVLLVRASAAVPTGELTRIAGLARKANFDVSMSVVPESTTKAGAPR
jgi:biopolymer transport protein ExbD